MSERHFGELLGAQWARGKFACVGIDPDPRKMPPSVAHGQYLNGRVLRWMQEIVDATHDIVCAYKPNYAFWEALGPDGIEKLRQLIAYIHRVAPAVPVIIDAKRADIGNTNQFTSQALFDVLRGDALTVHPWLGREAVQPFLDREDKGIFVLCRTSNPGASEFQDLPLPSHLKMYEIVARNVSNYWNENGNCGLVVGATYPHELASVRRKGIAPRMPILIPGVGTQGGDLNAAVRNGRNKEGAGFIINSSSSIIFASSGEDFAEAARRKALELDLGIRAVTEKEKITHE